MEDQVTEDDIGKPVVHGDDQIGRIVGYEHGTAHVEADPGITDVVRSKLGWSETTEDSFPLQEEVVEAVTDDEVRLTTQL